MMLRRADFILSIVAWSAYLSIFAYVYWDTLLYVWHDQTAASWAQGLGSLAAVVIAVWAHLHKLSDDRRREMHDRIQRAVAVALAIYPALTEVASRLAVIQKRLKALTDAELGTPINELNKGLFPDIDIPPSLMRNADRLHLIGPNLIQAVALIETIDRFVDLAIKKQAAFTPRTLKEYADKLDLVLPRAKKEAAYYYNLPYRPPPDK